MALGGRAGYFLGGKVGAGILKLLKNKKKVKAAYDDIFPSGDYKYDAEMVAESLVENNPESIVPLISLLAVNAIRLIQSLNIITSSHIILKLSYIYSQFLYKRTHLKKQ